MTKRVDDAPEITAELFAKMRPMKEITPGMAKAIKRARSGRPKNRHNGSRIGAAHRPG